MNEKTITSWFEDPHVLQETVEYVTLQFAKEYESRYDSLLSGTTGFVMSFFVLPALMLWTFVSVLNYPPLLMVNFFGRNFREVAMSLPSAEKTLIHLTKRQSYALKYEELLYMSSLLRIPANSHSDPSESIADAVQHRWDIIQPVFLDYFYFILQSAKANDRTTTILFLFVRLVVYATWQQVEDIAQQTDEKLLQRNCQRLQDHHARFFVSRIPTVHDLFAQLSDTEIPEILTFQNTLYRPMLSKIVTVLKQKCKKRRVPL